MSKPRKLTIGRRMVRHSRRFLNYPWAGGVILLICVVAAMLLANLPHTKAIYHSILTTPLTFTVGEGGTLFSFSLDVERFINDGLMVVFFFVVGLEIKREMIAGQLASLRQAILPVVAAVGGMLFPALIYTLFNIGSDYAGGWGIPTATDIAFAVAILSVMGRMVPLSLKIFLTALAIVDDLGAILVIALFYGGEINWACLLLIAIIIGILYLFRREGIYKVRFYMIPAILVWYLFYNSGIHATMAGVIMAMIIPSQPQISKRTFLRRVKYGVEEFKLRDRKGVEVLSNHEQYHALCRVRHAANDAISMSQRLEHMLSPYISYLIIPIFALANAGVEIQSPEELDIFSTTMGWGIFFGLVVGKPLGIFTASWLAVRLKVAVMPSGADWKMLLAVACLGGIGFTMSIFIDTLAFMNDPFVLDSGKIAVLLASTTASIVGIVLITLFSQYKGKIRPTPVKA